ncbi:ribonuclease H-like domain-containing protein [Tanacetum coccineum]
MHYRLSHPGQGILGPALAIYSSQPTTLPSAFSIMPPQDPTWDMDTGVSSHLIFNASNLSTIYNKRLFPYVHVNDGKSIPVTNTVHSIIPSHHHPLHLYNVLVTPNIIKNLISVRQFTSDNNFQAISIQLPSVNSPIAFLSTSASTWHQRLGHPGDEVLRSLVSSHFISCNKEKTSYICLACQHGKHVKLPFHSSDSTVEHRVNMVRSMWLFKHKFHADGTLSRYKARLVANSSSQQLRVDFDETFSPVVKLATVRTVLCLAVSRKWPIHQLDVKNSFLNGDLSKTMYMHQPPSFVDNRQGSQVTYLLIYVDDIILTTSCPALLHQIIGSLNNEFDMTNLGELNYFLGISVDRTLTGLFLSQKKYALHLLERAHMVTCNPSRTPVDIVSKLGPEGVPVQDLTLYRSLAGGLQYLTFTRLDLSYAVQQICLYMHDPREPHFTALKRCPSTRSGEAEYQGVANVVAETAWIRNLLRDLQSPILTTTLVYCDNNATIAAYAQNYANQRLAYCNLVHSGGPYDENLTEGRGTFTGTAAVNLWVAEKTYYNYTTSTCATGKVCGHYTQVVWRKSTELGCARV